MEADQRLGKPGRDLDVLAALGERLSAELDDLTPVRSLRLTLPVALRQLVVGASGLLDGVVGTRVAKRLAPRVVPGDG